MDVEQKETLDEPVLRQPPPSSHSKQDISVVPSGSSKESPKTILSYAVKTGNLLESLQSDPMAADVKWSLFVSAANNYKFDSCLKPFPSQFVKDDEKDIEALRAVIQEVPSFRKLSELLQKDSLVKKDVVELLHWVLIEQEHQLATVPKEMHQQVLGLAPSNMDVQAPNMIFEVVTKNSDLVDGKWANWHQNLGTMNAYHGSRLENFHSILRYGLQQHLNKNALFGAGIYLSSELGVSLPYSKGGQTWNGSALGSQLGCVALCHVLNHPDVKCQQGDSPEEVRTRSVSNDSIAGAIPEKYILVRNSDHVRIRYLLVYCKLAPPINVDGGSTLSWANKNKLLILMSAYIFLLVAIGVSNSHSAKRAIKQAFKSWWH